MKKYTSILSLFAILVFAGCSGKSGQSKNQNKMNNKNEEMSSSEQGKMSNDDMNNSGESIHVYGINQLKYVVANKGDNVETGKTFTVKGKDYYLLKGITASAGSELSIKLTNLSELAPSAMSHNWALLKLNTDAKAFSQAGAQAKDNDYIAPKMEDKVIKETGMVAGGKSKTIDFTVPDKTGDYDYVCTFPGHYSSGMKGTLTVK